MRVGINVSGVVSGKPHNTRLCTRAPAGDEHTSQHDDKQATHVSRQYALSCGTYETKGKPMRRFATALVLVLGGTVVCVEAQWLDHRDPKTPRTADGKPNLAAPAPRINGKPDVSGVWQAERTPTDEFVKVLGPGLPQIQPDLQDVTKHVIDVFWGVKPEEEPIKPEGVAVLRQNQASGLDFQPAYCLPTSL